MLGREIQEEMWPVLYQLMVDKGGWMFRDHQTHDIGELLLPIKTIFFNQMSRTTRCVHLTVQCNWHSCKMYCYIGTVNDCYSYPWAWCSCCTGLSRISAWALQTDNITEYIYAFITLLLCVYTTTDYSWNCLKV